MFGFRKAKFGESLTDAESVVLVLESDNNYGIKIVAEVGDEALIELMKSIWNELKGRKARKWGMTLPELRVVLQNNGYLGMDITRDIRKDADGVPQSIEDFSVIVDDIILDYIYYEFLDEPSHNK